jgi:hypothetical protein
MSDEMCRGETSRREAATSAGVYETFVRTAGIAKEKIARGNPLQILTAGETIRRKALIQPRGKILL